MNKEEFKFDGQTMDIEGNNLDKLKSVFPDCVVEGKLDIDKLMSLCGEYVDNDFEKYSFSWKGKAESLRLAQKRGTGTLRPCKEDSVDFDNTKNLYIEGDNLEVLRLLQSSYYRKIKMIYIDPPYNTGKDFVYEDDFKDPLARYKEITEQATKSNPETMGRFHTNWLNMMYPRLRLASNLLTDDGVIFISIDDNEVTNLKKLCDEVFGEENFIGEFVVNSTPNARDYGHIGKMHEYVLFYAKNMESCKTFLLPEINKEFKYNDNISGFNIHPLYNSNEAFTKKNRPNLYYPFYVNIDKKTKDGFYEISLEKTNNSVEVFPPKSIKNGVQFVWRWGKEKAKNNMNIEIIAYKVGDEYRIVQKMRHNEKLIRSLLLENGFSSRRGTAEVEQLFLNKIFSFPKPIDLIMTFIKVALEKNDIVLDFFSGSATTAHAVMQLNVEDGGNRKYICVQLPEQLEESSEAYKAGYKNICEIGKERIRRAGKKIAQENPNANIDTGFKVLKLDTSNISQWDNSPIEKETYNNTLMERMEKVLESTKPGRSKEDVLYEVIVKMGLPLDIDVKKEDFNGKEMYIVGDYAMIVSLDKGWTAEDMEQLCDLMPGKIVMADECFADSVIMSNVYYILQERKIELVLL